MTLKEERAFVLQSMRILAKGGVVLDVGGGGRFGKWMGRYRDLFRDTEYRTFDFDASTGSDVVGDIHQIPLQDASVDGIICSSVLEHVRDPLAAMSELRRILRPGGTLFLYVPSTYPYHARPGHYPDLWRFFRDTITILFEGFSDIRVEKQGGYFRALSFFVPGQHRIRGLLDRLADFLDAVTGGARRNTTAGYYVRASK